MFTRLLLVNFVFKVLTPLLLYYINYFIMLTWKQKSKYYCNYCDFDACPSHCEPGRECKPRSRCRNRHPLRYSQLSTTRGWRCNECNRISTGKHLQCHQCDYDMCSDCYFLELMVNMSLLSNSSNY
ncbi:hypothetical protein C2G38_2066137 [Gigaspora rosea]|uniref:Uncharacterized protein n=1 Tax=Gigaspora rosea TaxID=44941 RepID=A0A397W0Z9_9GLOM|nr:hypothetical protein C2G38_2066137 [Gigaspora rosea]